MAGFDPGHGNVFGPSQHFTVAHDISQDLGVPNPDNDRCLFVISNFAWTHLAFSSLTFSPTTQVNWTEMVISAGPTVAFPTRMASQTRAAVCGTQILRGESRVSGGLPVRY